MIRFKSIEYVVASHYLSALINGDYSGLDDDECGHVDDFNNQVTDQGEFSHYDTEGEQIDFAECEISGLMADCVRLVAHYIEEV